MNSIQATSPITSAWIAQHLNLHLALHPSLAAMQPSLSPIDPTAVTRSISRSKFQSLQKGFCYLSSGKAVVSLVARTSPTLRCDEQRPVGMIGFFVAQQDPIAIRRTLAAAVEWLQEQGCQLIVGPMDGDTWHTYRWNIGPHDNPPFWLEPTNPAYYPACWEEAHFRPWATYHSKQVESLPALIESTRPAWHRAHDAGYQFRPFDPKRFSQELRVVYELSTASFAGNVLYEEISWPEFQSLYQPIQPILQRELVWFAENHKGNPVGFLFGVIDYERAVRAMRGSRGWLGRWRFWRHQHLADAVNFKSIAVLPDHRQSSIGSALMHAGYRESHRLGFRRANLCLIHDDNPSAKLDQDQAKTIRRYVLYRYHKDKTNHA